MTPHEPYPLRAPICWVRVPDEPGSKRRPAVVVSPNSCNRLANDVIVVPVSTVLRDAPTYVRLRAREAGVAPSSVVTCEQVTTLRRQRLQPRPLEGALSTARMIEVEKAILHVIGGPIA